MTDTELQKDVQDAIIWEPLLHAAEIGVEAKDGVVTLSGTVDCYAKKSEAEKAAKSVAGVKLVVESIDVQFPNSWSRTDLDIASEVVNAMQSNWSVPADSVKVKVEKGWVTLDGEVPWNFERSAAMRAIRYLMGITGVTNNITIKSEVANAVEKAGIEMAFRRNSVIDSTKITVAASGHIATLSGSVNSWHQKDEAGRVAWDAPGVWQVDNNLVVDYPY